MRSMMNDMAEMKAMMQRRTALSRSTDDASAGGGNTIGFPRANEFDSAASNKGFTVKHF